MKKFLSLVLALVMTMSLVTIGAGAAEYKDLTDKSEIQYKEAVAVLNKLGIITGYEDGSFKPTGALTRGAAAKIIVSLMIGSEAASNLTVATAPYSDVPVTNTFAAVISYCKTAGYINGYADGTFRPTAPLTGYAFSKMLLGALGYDGKVEGFTGAGWTMNVAKLGNKAGLFDDFATAFKGNDGINREQACLLALNTLKATEVEYTGNQVTVKGDNVDVTVGNTAYSYVTSNNNNINHNISSKKTNDSFYTLEFGEEHFPDLKLVSGNVEDDYGRPSNQWSFKNVTIGKFAHRADFTYTTQITKVVDNDSVATREKALGLKGYDLYKNSVTPVINGKNGTAVTAVADIANLTDEGVTVLVYLDEDDADTISNIVVIGTQLMQIKKVSSSKVTFSRLTDDANTMITYNTDALNTAVNDVNDDDEVYEALASLKADDYVVVTPLWNGSAYDVDAVYVPQVITGKLTSVSTYTKSGTTKNVAVTVAGTKYKLSQWNQKFNDIDADSIKATEKDVTVYLDAMGNALLIKDAGSTTEFAVVKGVYQTLNSDGKMVYMVQAYDVSDGTEISLNVGTVDPKIGKTGDGCTIHQGDIIKYTNKGTSNSADYAIDQPDYDYKDSTKTGNKKGIVAVDNGYEIKTSSIKLNSTDSGWEGDLYYASNVKFIFVTFEDSGSYDSGKDVKSVVVKTGAQNVSTTDLTNAQAYVKYDKGNQVKAVVVMNEANDAVSSSMLYIRDTNGTAGIDADGKKIYSYTADINTADGVEENKTIYSTKSLSVGDFVNYALSKKDGYDPFYTLSSACTNLKKTTSVASGFIATPADGGVTGPNNELLNLTQVKDAAKNEITQANSNVVNAAGADGTIKDLNSYKAHWVDTTGNAISSGKDLKDFKNVSLTFVFNDNDGSDNYNTVSFIIVTDATEVKGTSGVNEDEVTYTVNASAHTLDLYINAANVDVAKAVEAAVKDAGFEFTGYAGGTAYAVAPNGSAVNLNVTVKYKVTAPAEVVAAAPKGGYTATVDKEYAAEGEIVTVTVTTKTAATSNADYITLGGVSGGNAATEQAAATLNGSKTFTFEQGADVSVPTIKVENRA